MNAWGRIVSFDLETTGVDVDTSRIVSACIAILDDAGEVVVRWDWLADPGIEIPDGAARVHGITTEQARKHGRPAAVVVGEIAQALRVATALDMPVVVYNAPYDLTLLDRECRRNGVPVLEDIGPIIDPLVLDKAVDRYRRGKRTLEATAALYGVELSDAHDAGSDAIAAGRVAQALVRAYPEELDIPTVELHYRQRTWYREQAERFQDYIRAEKGDHGYEASTAWPVRVTDHPEFFEDTQPIPAPPRRASLTVPEIDIYSPGALALGMLGSSPSLVYATAPPPKPPVATAELQPAPAELLPDPEVKPPPRRLQVLRVAAGIVTDAEGRTLVVRKRGTTAFMQAGGKIESGESALDALTRELLEEVGIRLDLDNTEYLGSFRAEAANEPDTVIRAEVFALTTSGLVAPSAEIEEIRWIDRLDTPGVELAPLTRDTILPLWERRRSAHY